MTNLKTTCIVVAMALLLGAVCAQAEIVNRIAAIVNDEIITLYEVEKDAGQMLLGLREQNKWTQQEADARLPEIKGQILEALVREKLFEHEVQKLGIPITEQDVDEYLEFIAERNRLNMEQLGQMIQREGKTMSEYRELIRKKIRREQYVRYRLKSGALDVSEEEKRSYYNLNPDRFLEEAEFELAEIRFSFPADDNQTALLNNRKRAEETLSKLLDGESFEAVAKKYSDAASAKAGGRMGWFKVETELKPAYSRIAQTLEPGRFSLIATDDKGLFILKVLDAKKQAAKPYEQVAEQIGNIIYNKKVDKQIEQLTDELYQKSFVDIKIDEF